MSHGQRSEQVRHIITLNKHYSDEFDGANARSNRLHYRSMENYHKIVTQCMDGRINIANATGTPLGVFKSFRNLGGHFDLKWEKFDDAVYRSYWYHLVEEKKGSLVLITYHYSRGDEHRGCAGFHYKTDEAMRAMTALKEQFERLYGDNTEAIIPILVGFETDEEALIFHGDKGKPLHMADICYGEISELKYSLEKSFRAIFPKRPRGAIEDLCFMAMKNIEHIADVRIKKRKIEDMNHKEWIIALGRGLDWFYQPNTALIVGMYSDYPEEPISKAAGIIHDNMMSGRIDKEKGFVLLSSASYGKENDVTFTRARERAIGYRELGIRIIKEHYPDIYPYMEPLTVVTCLDNRLFKIIE